MQVRRSELMLPRLWNSTLTLNLSRPPLSRSISTLSERREADRGGEAGRTNSDKSCGWKEIQMNLWGFSVTSPSLIIFSLLLTCVTEWGPNEALRPGLVAHPVGGSTNILWEKAKGLKLEKRGPISAWDRGRNCQEGGVTDIWTGRERGRGGCRRDGGTESVKEEKRQV